MKFGDRASIKWAREYEAREEADEHIKAAAAAIQKIGGEETWDELAAYFGRLLKERVSI